MATLAEIRAKLKSQEVNRSTSQTGGDNAIYPHWNIQEGSEAVLRFLPDKDTANTFFWTERNMIKLPFAGIKVKLILDQYKYKFLVWKCTEKLVQF